MFIMSHEMSHTLLSEPFSVELNNRSNTTIILITVIGCRENSSLPLSLSLRIKFAHVSVYAAILWNFLHTYPRPTMSFLFSFDP